MSNSNEDFWTNRYVSEFGWTINLPPEWKRSRRRVDDGMPNTALLATFWTPLDLSLSLTWMVSGLPVNDEALQTFDRTTMFAGRVQNEAASSVVSAIFPLAGTLLSAAVVELLDGNMALEYVETYAESISRRSELPVRKMTYALIMPFQANFGTAVHFQRLCYTAAPLAFHLQFSEIVEASRSLSFKPRAA